MIQLNNEVSFNRKSSIDNRNRKKKENLIIVTMRLKDKTKVDQKKKTMEMK